ncbi:biogenesis of lysosome-related organelles complex 1 subunit 3 [Phlebotomus argentipes]|uniref:biogenesis of lysosome-related organelles complex 1 subunit 3 n=1 Tax=Phlebotomus argentipes TaxID=94469 RepID=UPI0028933A89|nr:biogenesis of lysosome-related organelles complex 1 subunit 3 [Phlebotomus argentipes]
MTDSSSKGPIVIDGEAIESDDEIVSFSNAYLPIQTATELTESFMASGVSSPSRSDPQFSSILHRKLYERNELLWRHMHCFVQTTLLGASKQIIAADQQLLKSQIILQSVATAVKKLNSASTQVLERVRDIATSNFLPQINIS